MPFPNLYQLPRNRSTEEISPVNSERQDTHAQGLLSYHFQYGF